MGCSISSTSFAISREKELKSYLTDEDIRLVKESWTLIQDDLDSLGLAIFQRLFTRHGQLKRLFHNMLSQENSGAYVFDELKLMSHGKIVMEALGAAVECLEDSVRMTALLVGIGERHALYGVEPDMIPYLWSPIVKTIKERLGSSFTEKVGQAWEHVFQYIGSKLIEGISVWKQNAY